MGSGWGVPEGGGTADGSAVSSVGAVTDWSGIAAMLTFPRSSGTLAEVGTRALSPAGLAATAGNEMSGCAGRAATAGLAMARATGIDMSGCRGTAAALETADPAVVALTPGDGGVTRGEVADSSAKGWGGSVPSFRNRSGSAVRDTAEGIPGTLLREPMGRTGRAVVVSRTVSRADTGLMTCTGGATRSGTVVANGSRCVMVVARRAGVGALVVSRLVRLTGRLAADSGAAALT